MKKYCLTINSVDEYQIKYCKKLYKELTGEDIKTADILRNGIHFYSCALYKFSRDKD